MATVKAYGLVFSIPIASARPLCLPRKALALLFLLGALLTVFAPTPTWAQFTHTQITNSIGGTNYGPSINADGTRIAFMSAANLTGGNPDSNGEIFLWTQGSGITQLTSSAGGSNYDPSINADGTRIAFHSTANLTGDNADGSIDIFLWTQGSGLTQIPNSTVGYYSLDPSINADGTRIAFYSNRNLTGGNADGSTEIFLWTQGAGLTQITTTTGNGSFNPSINADGTRIAFMSAANLTGGNADGKQEIFLWTSGSGITQLTTSTGGGSAEPSINADGTRIAFVSWSNLTGGNADGSTEIFLWTQGAGLTQITNSIVGYYSLYPSINTDGTRIAFHSNNNLTGGNADGSSEIFLWTQGAGFTQITNSIVGYSLYPSINTDGTRIAFQSNNNLTGGNADGSQEIFLTERVCVAPPSDMVSWWPGDGNANDILGTNHGALVNGATFASGIVSQGFSFDGVDDEVLIGNPTNLRLQDFTIDAWIRLNTLTITGFAERIAGYSIGGYGFFLAGPSVVNTNGASAVRQLSLDKAGFDMVAAPFAINDTGWHHVAVTKSGGTVTFYLDGVAGAAQRGGLPIASYNPGFVFNTNFTLGNLDGQVQPFPGLLDEIEVFNRALSAAEIQAIFNAGSEGKCKTALPDTTPDPFTFTDLTGVPLSTVQISNTITVSGITAPAAITIVGGEYEVNSSGVWSSSTGTAANGDTVRVRHTSAATYSTAVDTTLTIGGVSDTFTSTTVAIDTTPDPFTFTDQTGVLLDTIIPSNAITVTGINSPATISIPACTSSSCEHAINGGVWTGTSGTVTNGQTVQVRQRSAATPAMPTHLTLAIGGVADTFSVTTLADTTPPVLTLPANITAPATSAAGAVVTYVATATDAIDGALTPTCAPPAGSTFPIGTTTVTCSATDAAGNTASSSFHVTVTDTVPPSLTLPADITIEATSPGGAIVTFAAAATDAIDGMRPVTCAPPSGSTFALGTTLVACSASDTHGNTVSGSFHVTVTDTTPPILTLPADITTPATSAAGAMVTYVATATDAIDGALIPTCAPPAGSMFALGTATVTCSASDTHGNTVSGSFNVTVVDTTPPDTSVDSGPTSPTNATTATFTVSGTDDVTPPASLTFECSLDGGGFSACTSPTTYNGLTAGAHTFTVRARDAAGNTDPTPATFHWSVDTAPPDTILDSMPDSLTPQTTATVTFHATEPGSTFECSLDGVAFTACTSPAQYTSLADGPHTFQVRAIDPAGNPDPTPASVMWTVDTLTPDTLIDSHPADPTNSNTPTFTFHASEGSSFVCQLDAEPSAACNSGTVTYTGLGAGAHTFTVTATDLAGNPDPTSATFTWTIDVTAPDTTITAGPAEGATTTATSATFAFTGTDNLTLPETLTFACSLDGAPFTGCTSPISYAGLSRDPHTFAVRATDAAGNPDPTPATRTWTITKLTPVLTWTTPADITYPTPLSATQLNATADVAGSFVYTPPSGTVLNAGASQPLSITFTPTDTTNHHTASKTVTLTVQKANPTVTFTGAPATAPSGATFTVASTTNSSASPVYTASGACANVGTLYTITSGAGTCTSTVTWTADSNYNGATRSQTTMVVVVDSTPPTTTAAPSPLPNSYGWNTTNVTVSLNATDNAGGTGVREIAFTLTGAQNGGGVVSGSVATVTVTTEGITTLTYFARDNAGNQEIAKILTVQIDTTAPELAARCAPTGAPLVVVGRDGLSGAASVVPGASVPLHQGKFKERRTFIVLDLAGNQLQADFGVKAEGHEAQIALLGLAYNGHAVPDLPENELKCEWALEKKTGAVKELEQKLTIEDQSESRSEHDKTEAQAKFRAGRNETEIRIKKPEPDQKVIRPGVVFLRLTTDQGDVGFDF